MVILLSIGEEGDSSQVVSVAYDLATTYGDDLVALHVVPEDEFEHHRSSIRRIHDFQNFSFRQEEDSAARFAREVVEEAIDDPDPDIVDARGRIGDPETEILSVANSLDTRFLVVGGKKRSPVGKAVFGSVTQSVLLNADCPVVTALHG